MNEYSEPAGECRKSAGEGEKLRYDLLPIDPVEDIIRVLGFGAAKYGDNNWTRGARWGRYYAALQRHTSSWWKGEDVDPETGLSHLAHAGCCLLFLMAYQRNGWGADDRYRGPDGVQFRKDDGVRSGEVVEVPPGVEPLTDLLLAELRRNAGFNGA